MKRIVLGHDRKRKSNFPDPVGRVTLEGGPAWDDGLARRSWEWTENELQGREA